VGGFLHDVSQADVVSKLVQSGAAERHAAVVVDLTGAPWSVISYFTGELEQLPEEAPNLPDGVTAVWIIPLLGEKGLYWDGSRWRLVAARGEGIEGPPPS
jgi:hypothetical protein